MQLMKRSLSSSTQEEHFNASNSLSCYTKRLRLCSSRLPPLNSVHDRIFRLNSQHLFRCDDKIESGIGIQATLFDFTSPDASCLNGNCGPLNQDKLTFRQEAPVPELPSFASLFDVLMEKKRPFSNQSPAMGMKSTSLPSSTPSSGESVNAKSTGTPTERQVYKRLLNEASALSKPSARVPTEELTIIIDDGIESIHSSALNRCSLSPIRINEEVTQKPSTSHAFKAHPLVLARPKSKSSQLLEPDQVDREARAWLKACERTPFLSSDWLNHLTFNYQNRADQRAKERELAEAKLRHCEKQFFSCTILPLFSRPLSFDVHDLYFSYTKRHVKYHIDGYGKFGAAFSLFASDSAGTRRSVFGSSTDSNRTSIQTNSAFGASSLTREANDGNSGTGASCRKVINFYMQLLYHRSQNQPEEEQKRPLPRIAVLSTFFYAKLVSNIGGGYSGVRRWSRQLKLLDQDLVLIPIHDRGMHWCLACIDFRSKTITYYDSMGSPNNRCLQSLKSYLEEECKDKKGHPLLDSDSWKLVNTEDSVPQQMNGSDCGVFMCTYGEFLSRNARFTFSQVSQSESGFCLQLVVQPCIYFYGVLQRVRSWHTPANWPLFFS
ncbi:Sentrin-specific protease 1 [Fasciola gigantica]|uniref:Sentrin-specific protease 1 n=1 Tax=Fasciola gigantica TaxID=46835 RepID=A0A504YDV8_FASGI|nr:Sentrin-specific protease 1 [Fasciola gigantica]